MDKTANELNNVRTDGIDCDIESMDAGPPEAPKLRPVDQQTTNEQNGEENGGELNQLKTTISKLIVDLHKQKK